MRRPEFIARQAHCPSGFLGHMIARVMALNGRAAVELERGNRAEGERLVRLAHREATRLGLTGQVDTARNNAESFGISLDDSSTNAIDADMKRAYD